MTKKDYELIADVLGQARRVVGTMSGGKESIDLVENLFVQKLRKDNPRFKPVTFRKACGVTR